MMITDLFSHKIHSSGPEWPDKLVELAAIFSEFDGQVYDRSAIENRLRQISPRVAFAARNLETPRDLSKFRDEISAYPAFLGLYHICFHDGEWHLQLSNCARKFLLREEPDVASFLRLQLTLFQYPNAAGAQFGAHDRVHIVHNAAARTMELIENGVHVSPLRLICAALAADAELRDMPLLQGECTYREIYALANDKRVNQKACPAVRIVREVLMEIRAGRVVPPGRFESRFHILNHLEVFDCQNGRIAFRERIDEEDAKVVTDLFESIASTKMQFNGFDNATAADDLANIVRNGTWAQYFDGVSTIRNRVASFVTPISTIALTREAIQIYPLRDRIQTPGPNIDPPRRTQIADPEQTRIKRERRNLAHKELLDRTDELLRAIGAVPQENSHIDLFAQVPDDGSFLFEIKSGGENLLAQIRKGLSQLYEYRFRYRQQLPNDVALCLVLPERPTAIPWAEEYLSVDRGICVFWFDEHGALEYPPECEARLEPLQRE
ncbi:MAG: hypothetical protein HYX26_06670 [Acidobacteriales bacterium]|nr:hypothetical protein [Terriglobales bacterium]